MMRGSGSDVIDDDDGDLTAQIEEQVNEWSSNSNECLSVVLIRGDESVAAAFNPEFTHAFFGEEEAIFGYQDLQVTLSFAAHDLTPQLDIEFSNKFEEQGDVRPTDIEEALREFLPSTAFDAEPPPPLPVADFRPPGQRIHEYERQGKTYQIWRASLSDPTAQHILKNMQILVPMLIDGGSMLELDQQWTAARWNLFLVYEFDQSPDDDNSKYALIGYGTSYRNFSFPERRFASGATPSDDPSDAQSLAALIPSPNSAPNEYAQPPAVSSPLELLSRERLSQFLILPPFHGAGHGQELYTTMYQQLSSPANIREFTVEDPNERFDDLRDFCDLLYLRANVPQFAALRVNTNIPTERLASKEIIPVDLIVPIEAREKLMRETKIMPRQFDRLVEMHTLSFIPQANRSRARLSRRDKSTNEHDKAYYFWRLYAKQRLYNFNRDQLNQVEHSERVEKLEAALDSVQEAYGEMIEKVKAREEHNAAAGDSAAKHNTVAARKKRKVIDDDDPDEVTEVPGPSDAPVERPTNGHKKPRVDDTT
ncbi:hypothetical protein MRB53_042011 [Persea americana]|nr:hypothetical protein MRB53_042011 [Persea americana]